MIDLIIPSSYCSRAAHLAIVKRTDDSHSFVYLAVLTFGDSHSDVLLISMYDSDTKYRVISLDVFFRDYTPLEPNTQITITNSF